MKKKINALIFVVVATMLLSIVFLIQENHSFQRQIEERDGFIRYLLLRDSITSRLVKIEDQDSMFIYSYSMGDDGQILTYDDLQEKYLYYRKESEIKDRILVRAKHYYKFNYSVKVNGDTIILGFWDKDLK